MSRTRKDKTLTDKEIKELCKEEEKEAEFKKRLGINYKNSKQYEEWHDKVMVDMGKQV